jgi:predicted nucleic acid-binding protein
MVIMTEQPNIAKEFVAAAGIRSDGLVEIREWLESFPEMARHMRRPESARLVLDANVVIKDVRWMVKTRQKVDARSALQEVIASGTIVAFAPSFLNDEVEARLADVAAREEIPLEPLMAAWIEYRRSIRFYEVARPTSATVVDGRDSKDIPYIEVYTQLAADAILTEDPHLANMGARTIKLGIVVSMRDYARAASIELTLKWHGITLVTLGVAVFGELAKLVRSGIAAFRRMPRELQVIAALAILCALLHKPTRDVLLGALEKGWEALVKTAGVTLPVLQQLMVESRSARTKASSSWELAGLHHQPRKVPLKTQALAVCVAAGAAISTKRIVEELGRLGVRTKAKSFNAYLRRVLRAHPRLREISPNMWTVTAI